MKTPTYCPKKELEQGSADVRRPAQLLVLRPPLRPGFHLVQPGLEALAHPPQHAGEVRVVEGNHLRAVAPPGGARQILKSSKAKPSLRSPFMSGRLYCLASTESKSCLSSATSASAISVFTRLSDKFVKLVLQTTLPVLPAITRQPGFLWFVVRDSCVERLLVCASASSLIMMSSHWCVPLSGAALLLDTCSLLQPAQFFVRKRSSEKSEVLVTVSVLEAKSCGAETVPELVTSPHTAVKVQSRLSQSSGPAEAAPVIVSVAPVSAPVAAKLAAVAAPEAVSVPVDTSPTVVKFPALAMLLMVNVLPVIPVAELSRPTLAAPLMLSELPDTAPVDVSVAPATVPVAVSAAQETAPEASTPVVNTSVLRGEPVQRGRAREGQRVRQQVRHPRRPRP